MRNYKLKEFSRWARKVGLADAQLWEALEEMSGGLVGDRLGESLFKKRIGLGGRGKRGGCRAILLYRKDDLAVFIYGYAKNEKSDLEPRELAALRLFVKELLNLSDADLDQRELDGVLVLLKEN